MQIWSHDSPTYLARSSTERAPAGPRGGLNTPLSNRLYQSKNPSRSHNRIFSRSPRRERKTNSWPLRASWPMTVRTRSAKRSNPKRMSVASVANQMRELCVQCVQARQPDHDADSTTASKARK